MRQKRCSAQDALLEYPDQFEKNWLSGMRGKLGLFGEEPEDKSLIHAILKLMDKYHADYTNTFLALTFNQLEDTGTIQNTRIFGVA